MVNLYIKQLKSKWFFLFITSIVMMNIYFYQDFHSSGTTLDSWLIHGNFITMFVNNAFFIFCLNRVKIFQNIKEPCSLRLDKDKLVNNLFIVGIINVIIYTILCYIIISVYQFNLIQNTSILIKYIFISIIMFFIYEVLYIIVILDKKRFYLLFFPFIINLVFHYIFVIRFF